MRDNDITRSCNPMLFSDYVMNSQAALRFFTWKKECTYFFEGVFLFWYKGSSGFFSRTKSILDQGSFNIIKRNFGFEWIVIEIFRSEIFITIKFNFLISLKTQVTTKTIEIKSINVFNLLMIISCCFANTWFISEIKDRFQWNIFECSTSRKRHIIVFFSGNRDRLFLVYGVKSMGISMKSVICLYSPNVIISDA